MANLSDAVIPHAMARQGDFKAPRHPFIVDGAMAGTTGGELALPVFTLEVSMTKDDMIAQIEDDMREAQMTLRVKEKWLKQFVAALPDDLVPHRICAESAIVEFGMCRVYVCGPTSTVTWYYDQKQFTTLDCVLPPEAIQLIRDKMGVKP